MATTPSATSRPSPPCRALVVFALLLLPSALSSRPRQAPSDAEAHAYLTAQVAANGFMGAVLVLVGGEPLTRRAYGMADLEHRVPNTPDTRFRIGSISKMYNATLVRLLQQEGALDEEDTLDLYFEGLPAGWERIRLTDLVHHRAGILDIEEMPDYQATVMLPTQPRETMQRFFDDPLRFVPGTRFEYSSSGYVVLAAIVELVSDQGYEDVLRARLLDPLGLADTGHDRHGEILPRRARGYAWTVRGLENAPYIHMDLPIGGGELYSTVDDLARWAKVLEGTTLLTDESRAALFAPVAVSDPATRRELLTLSGVDVASGGGYAHGWFVGTQHGRLCRQHGGAINGFVAYVVRFPEEDATVVVLSNQEAYFEIVEIGVDLAAIAFGEEYELPPPPPDVEPSEETLATYVGRYELRPGVDLTITRHGNLLAAQIADGAVDPIFPRSEVDFSFKTHTMKITFVPGADGAVDEVDLHVGQGRTVRGKRKK